MVPYGITDPHETSAKAIRAHPLPAYYGEACQLDIVQYPRPPQFRILVPQIEYFHLYSRPNSCTPPA